MEQTGQTNAPSVWESRTKNDGGLQTWILASQLVYNVYVYVADDFNCSTHIISVHEFNKAFIYIVLFNRKSELQDDGSLTH